MGVEDTTPQASSRFAKRLSVEQVEEGSDLAPKFDADGLIPCITTQADTGEVLMLGYMTSEALDRTIETGEAGAIKPKQTSLEQPTWRKPRPPKVQASP